MVGMGLGLGHRQKLVLKHSLDHRQRLELKQLLILRLALKHPEFPNASKGLEGMLAAHEVLKENKASGILVGGLAEAVWSQRRTEDELYAHKDVDVLVLDSYHDIKRFEGGVDWWMPCSDRIKISIEYGFREREETWYKNGNGVVLTFGISKNMDLPPGLYIPNRDWVIDMREAEAHAGIDYGRDGLTVDYDVSDAFRKRLEGEIHTRLPRFVQNAFDGYILSSTYEPDTSKVGAVGVVPFGIDTVRAVLKHEGIGYDVPASEPTENPSEEKK